jgi:hypothetical protein
MSLGRRGGQQKQESIWIEAGTLAKPSGHPFYERLTGGLENKGSIVSPNRLVLLSIRRQVDLVLLRACISGVCWSDTSKDLILSGGLRGE